MQNKVAYAFNTFLLDLIKDVKNIDGVVADAHAGTLREVRSNYKVFDKTSVAHVEWFNAQIADNESSDDLEMVKGCGYGTLKEMFGGNDADLAALQRYLIVFKILAILYNDVGDEPSTYTMDTLNAVMQRIKGAKSGDKIDIDIDDDGLEILDDRINVLLDELDELTDAAAEEEVGNIDVGVDKDSNIKTFFENSTIGTLAQEISKEINMDELKGANPSDILNATFNGGSLEGGSANVLGSVVSKVSSKIHERIASGALKQDDLISEAMNLMSMLNLPSGGGSSGGGMFPPDLLANIGAMLKTVDPSAMASLASIGATKPSGNRTRKHKR